jgi:hypothetical protein
MARGTKKTSAKKTSGAKARSHSAGKQRSGKGAAAQKRGAARKPRGTAAASENLFGAMSTLVGTALGREIIAEVLEAAAATLRRRGGMAQVAEDAREQASETAATAVDVATEVASGTVGLAQTAAGVLAGVATDAARSMLPGAPNEGEAGGRSAGRQRSGARARE